MRFVALLLGLSVLSGCTHISVSDHRVLSAEKTSESINGLQDFPLNINAEMQCHTSTGAPTMGGVTKNTNCSNKGRVIVIDKIFRDNGLKIIPSSDSSAPTITVRTKKINGFLEQTTGFFNLMTLGILPMYSYTDYMVSYTSDKDSIAVSKKVRISSTNSWFSLMLSNPENLSEKEIERRAEANLIRAVLDEAKLKHR